MVKKLIIPFIFFIILQIILSEPSCQPEVNFCLSCNPVTKLCVKCEKDIYTIDDKGGCTYARKCKVGENYCSECSEDGKICSKCEDNYYPDKNGGCSYSDFCEISYRGICLECQEDFILIGIDDFFINGVRICKWANSEDLKNCDRINTANGSCIFCKEGYYLNSGDRKCTKTEHCYQSAFGICQKCNEGFYLDKNENKCKIQTDNLKNCKESIDGKTCSICDEDYYIDEDGHCISINYCAKSNNYGKCIVCKDNYYLTNYENACTKEKNCFSGDKDFGICYSCLDGYYLDLKDRKCKSNQEDNDYKYCEEVNEEGFCKKCIYQYYLGEDKKCSKSQYCSESENQICHTCVENYHLGLDNLCTNVEHCIYSNYLTSQCTECEDNYYFNINNRTCKIAEGNFINCKSSNSYEFCEECKNNYYLNQSDNLCYSNKEKGEFYKCALTTPSGDSCMSCIENYYLGAIDNKCTTVEGCKISESENKCKKCDEYYYCLDVKTGKCERNNKIISDEKKFYYNCNITNEEGTGCQICLFDFIVNQNGLCVDDNNCEEKKEGICQKCKADDDLYYYCLNKDFGCIEMFDGEGCLECNDIFDLNKCTKCIEGYELDHKGKCSKI